jgi:hypothetical protein
MKKLPSHLRAAVAVWCWFLVPYGSSATACSIRIVSFCSGDVRIRFASGFFCAAGALHGCGRLPHHGYWLHVGISTPCCRIQARKVGSVTGIGLLRWGQNYSDRTGSPSLVRIKTAIVLNGLIRTISTGIFVQDSTGMPLGRPTCHIDMCLAACSRIIQRLTEPR